MTTEEKTALTVVSVMAAGIGGYLIYKYATGVSNVSQTVVAHKVSSKCDSSANGAQITIGWNSVVGAATYNIIHEGGNVIATGITGTTYMQDDLYIGNWTVKVQAVNSAGKVMVDGAYVTLKVCASPGDGCPASYQC